jgi:hypothetical protein
MAQQFLHNPALGASYVATGNPQTVNEATPFAPGQVGAYTVDLSGISIPSGTVALGVGAFPRIWQFVKLSATSATPAFGQVVCWEDGIAQTVTTGTTAALRNKPAGIVTSSSVTVGNYIWILVEGVGPGLNEAATTPAAGDVAIVGGTTAGRITTVAAGTAPTHVQIGTFLGTKTTAFDGSSALPTDTCAVLYKFPRYGNF